MRIFPILISSFGGIGCLLVARQFEPTYWRDVWLVLIVGFLSFLSGGASVLLNIRK